MVQDRPDQAYVSVGLEASARRLSAPPESP
jgi:hypothetical protein